MAVLQNYSQYEYEQGSSNCSRNCPPRLFMLPKAFSLQFSSQSTLMGVQEVDVNSYFMFLVAYWMVQQQGSQWGRLFLNSIFTSSSSSNDQVGYSLCVSQKQFWGGVVSPSSTSICSSILCSPTTSSLFQLIRCASVSNCCINYSSQSSCTPSYFLFSAMGFFFHIHAKHGHIAQKLMKRLQK